MAGALAPGELIAARASARDGFALATHEDDADLRALLRRSAMPGAIRVAFTREPSYFAAEGLGGGTDYTLVHRSGGAIDGVARLSVHRMYRNGTPARVGYLAELRIDPSADHSARLLREGFARIREYAAVEGVEYCFTSIAHDNERARHVLEHGGRLGLPRYVPLADLITLVARVPRRTRRESHGLPAPDEAELTALLDRHARAYDLSLTWDDERWRSLARHGLGPADFCTVRESDRIVAAGAVWDQRPFRQVLVCGYQGLLRLVRPVVAAVARIGVVPSLPPAGTMLAQGMIVGAVATEGRHWPPLVRALLSNAAERRLAWVTLARDARDPELPVLRTLLRAREYRTRLYQVRWTGDPGESDATPAALVRPEVALL